MSRKGRRNFTAEGDLIERKERTATDDLIEDFLEAWTESDREKESMRGDLLQLLLQNNRDLGLTTDD